MSTRVEITGDEFSGTLAREVEAESREELEQRALDAAREWRDEAVRGLRSSGEPAAGGPPVSRTGELAEAMIVTRPAWDTEGGNQRVASSVFWTHPKAGGLEHGGMTGLGVFRPPFPFIRSALERARGRMIAILEGR